MTVQSWDSIYNHNVRWAIRRMADDNISFFNDSREDWITCLLELDKLEKEIFDNYLPEDVYRYNKESTDSLTLTVDSWCDLCHKYMSKYEDNFTIKFFFFSVWQDGRFNFKDGYDSVKEVYEPATEEEIKFARENFSHISQTIENKTYEHKHTFTDDAEVLVYRGHRFIIDKEWHDAWYKKGDRTLSQQIEWDWYYVLDEWLDL